MQLCSSGTDAIGQSRFDVHVHVFQLNPKREFPFGNLRFNLAKTVFDLAELFSSQNPCPLQCFGVSNRAENIESIQSPIERNRLRETLQSRCCLLSKSSFPQCGRNLPERGLEASAKRGARRQEIGIFSGEAVTQGSLGHSPRNSAPKKSIALKARFNLAGETPYGSRLVMRFQR